MENQPASIAKLIARASNPLLTIRVDFVFSEPFFPQCKVVTQEQIVERATRLLQSGKVEPAKALVYAMARAVEFPDTVERDTISITATEKPSTEFAA